MSHDAVEKKALAQLQRGKAAYQSFIKLNYEHAASDCNTCPTRGLCCTDAHFVNVHITRLEAVAIRETLKRTPRLTDLERRAVYDRARSAVDRFHLSTSGDTFAQTYSCPLYHQSMGCLVHRRAKPAPCIQHACYENWRDLPPTDLQSRMEHRVEQLNTQVYGSEWDWLPIPVWLTLIDPDSSDEDLDHLLQAWHSRGNVKARNRNHAGKRGPKRASLPVIATHSS